MRTRLIVLIGLWLGCLFASQAQAAGRVALIIGNGEYQNAPRLPNPVNDAQDVAAAFERLGFSVKLVSNGNFDVMRRALLEFARKASAAEIAVVFFAGHGLEIRDENWLIPIDAELELDSSASNEAVALASILPIVSSARKLGLIILDACRDNPFSKRIQMSQPGRSLPGRGLVSIEPPGSVLVAFAAKHGTTADDGRGRNSPFTTALLRNLEVPGLEINYLFRNVHDEVYSATQQHQEPYVYGSLSKDPIYLKPSVDPPVAAAPAASSEAAQTWAAVKETKSQEVLKKFIESFGDTIYGALARERLSNLGNAVPAVPDAAKASPKDSKNTGVAMVSPVQSAPPLPSDQGGKSERGVAIYNGKWTGTASGSCPHVSSGTATINNGIIKGVMFGGGGSGRVSADGSVSGRFEVIGVFHGTLSGKMTSSTSGSGSWRNNVGCTGGWTLSR
jgi:uncharacterized caspase-like protein